MQNFHPSVDDIEQEYERGHLQEVEDDLSTFLEERRDKIFDFRDDLAGTFPDRNIDLGTAIKTYILQIRSINPEYEIRKEMKDIEREVQRRRSNQDGDVDREKVVQEWCDRFAPSWRDRHVMTVIYVFERNREKYLSIIRGNG